MLAESVGKQGVALALVVQQVDLPPHDAALVRLALAGEQPLDAVDEQAAALRLGTTGAVCRSAAIE